MSISTLVRRVANSLFLRPAAGLAPAPQPARNDRSAAPRGRLSLATLLLVALVASVPLMLRLVHADNAPQALPFAQDWTNTGLITVDDNWSGVPGIVGYRGDGLTGGTAVNPQTVVAESTVVDVNANQTNPNTFTTGGVSEFHLPNPVVALQGSGTARAPYLQLNLNTRCASSRPTRSVATSGSA